MFEIDHMDFIGNNDFEKILGKLFPGLKMERINDDDVSSVRVYIPKRGNTEVSKNKGTWKLPPKPAWRKEVRGNIDIPKWEETPSEPSPKPAPIREPKSILEMLESDDERLERLLGKIIDKKLAERNIVANNKSDDDEDEDESHKKDTSVFIANRLTFLIQTLQPIVFDTSNIEVASNTMTIAINGDKTFPKISTIDDLGFITSKINASPTVIQEIEDYLKDTEYTNIYCFPTTMEDKDGNDVFAIKFVVYPSSCSCD